MSKKHPGIFQKLMITYIIVAIIPVVIVGVGLYDMCHNMMLSKLDTSIQSTLEQININIDNKILQASNKVGYYANNKRLKDLIQEEITYDTVQEVDEIINNFHLVTAGWEDQLTIFGKNKQIFINWTTDGRIIEENFAGELTKSRWYQQMIQQPIQRIWMTNMHSMDKYDSKHRYIAIARSIDKYNSNEDNIGGVVVGIAEDTISNLFKIGNDKDQLVGYLIDENGIIIAHRDNSKLGVKIVDDKIEKYMARGSKGNFVSNLEGIKQKIFYKQLNSNPDWSTVLAMPYKNYASEMYRMFKILGGIIISAIILAISIAYISSKSISRPIKDLVRGVNEVSKGNFDSQVGINQDDEVGILGIQFNQMVKKIKGLMASEIEHQNRQKDLELLNKNTELKMLRAQINPHFLFNTLNSIKCLAIINNAKQVAHMIGQLGILLEHSMGKGSEIITVKEEIELLNSYVEIQGMRYGNKIIVTNQIEEDVWLDSIPKFILQPIVENAMIHAFDTRKGRGEILVHVYKKDKEILFEVSDNGKGISDEALENFQQTKEQKKKTDTEFNGIGINNIDKRIKIIFGPEYGITIVRRVENGTGTVVVIKLPILGNKEEQ